MKTTFSLDTGPLTEAIKELTELGAKGERVIKDVMEGALVDAAGYVTEAAQRAVGQNNTDSGFTRDAIGPVKVHHGRRAQNIMKNKDVFSAVEVRPKRTKNIRAKDLTTPEAKKKLKEYKAQGKKRGYPATALVAKYDGSDVMKNALNRSEQKIIRNFEKSIKAGIERAVLMAYKRSQRALKKAQKAKG